MATNLRSMPLVVIEHCSSDEPCRKPIRSFSLTNCSTCYKDLQGALHPSSTSSMRFQSNLFRCQSFPTNSSTNLFETTTKSPSTSFKMNCLDPNLSLAGSQTPGGSLYGSFFDVSECGAYSPSFNERNESKMLTFAGRPLIIVDQTSRSTPNTSQEKCLDWLRQLKSNTN